MLDPDVSCRARERIRPRMEERRRPIRARIEAINLDMMLRGLGNSGARTAAIQEACEQEAAARVALAWAELQTILHAVGVRVTEELVGELQAEIKQQIDVSDLVSLINSVPGDDARVRAAADRALEVIGSDIDLYVVRLKRAADEQGRAGQPIYNFGVVQTGAYSTATVVQHFGSAERQALQRALEELRTQIAALEAGVMSDQAEVVELIDEARAETVKERPNRRRLTWVLGGIATTIQTVGAAQAAYLAVKVAAAAFGIILP